MKLYRKLLLCLTVFFCLFIDYSSTAPSKFRKIYNEKQMAPLKAVFNQQISKDDFHIRPEVKLNNEKLGKRRRIARSNPAINSDDYAVWPDGTVPYEIDDSLYEHRDVILEGMQHIMNQTCIRFVERTQWDRDYVKIFQGNG